jgi:Flp pilus assembly protein TadD
MYRVILCSVVVCMTAGCAATSVVHSPLAKSELLSSASLFDAPIPEPVRSSDVLRLDGQMRTFVSKNVGNATDSELRLRNLLRAMHAYGLLALDYDASATQTVQQTFYDREGNCLSFTMLFVALARLAGLDADYELVDIPPSWSAGSDILVLAKHINARVATRGGYYVIDFDSQTVRGRYRRHTISDHHALALFYNNRGAEALIAEDFPTSFANFKQAIETDARVPGAWVNLGLLYSRLGRPERAEAAYLQALALDPDEPSALTDLATFYARTGDEVRAELYRKRVHRYQQQNPYYHYFLAREAYSQQRFGDALTRLDKAIRLKSDEEQFYALQGQVYDGLGMSADAERSFDRAKKFAALGGGVPMLY